MTEFTRPELTELLALVTAAGAAALTGEGSFDRAQQMRVMVLNGIEIKLKVALSSAPAR